MFNLFKIKENKTVITLFLLISAVIGTMAVFLNLSPPNCDGLGCITLTSFLILIATLPTYPALVLIDFLTIGFTFGSLESPIILKFVPIFFIFANSFIFGLLCASIYISFKKRLHGEEFGSIKYVAKKFLLYFFVWEIVFSTFIVVKYPLKPFLSDAEIVSVCKARNYVGQDRNCLINYLVYKLPNCQNKTQSFYYHLNFYSSKIDSCVLDNFITKRPFKDMDLGESWYSPGWLKFNGKYPDGDMGDLLNFFDPLLINIGGDKKVEFCNSFSSRGKFSSNQAWCKEHLELSPVAN